MNDAQLSNPNPKYLKLLSTFIKIDDGVIKSNQEIVLNTFFKNPKNKYMFKFSSSYKHDRPPEEFSFESNELSKLGKAYEVLIAYSTQEPTSISTFFKKEERMWNYFIAYVNLMADVCMNRNSESIEFISG